MFAGSSVSDAVTYSFLCAMRDTLLMDIQEGVYLKRIALVVIMSDETTAGFNRMSSADMPRE